MKKSLIALLLLLASHLSFSQVLTSPALHSLVNTNMTAAENDLITGFKLRTVLHAVVDVLAQHTTQLNKIYYVSPSGNDSNDGLSPGSAWQTITKVNSYSLLPGTTVRFEGGQSFTGTIGLDSYDAGTAGNPVTIESYGAGRATIVGSNARAMFIQDCRYLVIRNLILSGVSMPSTGFTEATAIDGIYLTTSSTSVPTSNILIENVEAYGFTFGRGIGSNHLSTATAGLDRITIQNVVVHDNGDGIKLSGPYVDYSSPRVNKRITIRRVSAHHNAGIPSRTSGHSGNGIALFYAKNSTIEYCEAYENGLSNAASSGPVGIWLDDADSCRIAYSESHHNHSKRDDSGVDGGGFDLDGGCKYCTVEYCYSHDNVGYGLLMGQWDGAAGFGYNVMRYNISQNDGRNTTQSVSFRAFYTGGTGVSGVNKVHNNVFYTSKKGIRYGAATPSVIHYEPDIPLEFRNNIVIADGSGATIMKAGSDTTFTRSNNRYYVLNGATAGISSGGTTGDPQLQAIGTAPTVGVFTTGTLMGYLDAYKLILGSACINAGYTFALPVTDFFGNAAPNGSRDIGVHEF